MCTRVMAWTYGLPLPSLLWFGGDFWVLPLQTLPWGSFRGQEPPTGRCCPGMLLRGPRARGFPKNLLPPWAARLAPRGLPKPLGPPRGAQWGAGAQPFLGEEEEKKG